MSKSLREDITASKSGQTPRNCIGRTRSARVASQLGSLLPFLKPHRWALTAAATALIFTAAVSLAIPFIVRTFIDNFYEIASANTGELFIAGMLAAAFLAVGTGLRYALISTVGERVVANIRKAAFDRAITLSPAYFETTLTGEVLSRINTDTTLVLTVVSSSLSIALRNIIIFFGGLLLMLTTSFKLTLLVLLVVPAVLVPLLTLGRKLRKLSRENQDRVAEGSANASEILLSIQSVQANTHELESQERFAEIVDRSVRAAYARIKIRVGMTMGIILLSFWGVVTVIWTGTLDVAAERMSPGELTQFVILAVMVASSVASLSEVWGEMVRAAGATDRLAELLAAKDMVTDPKNPVAPAKSSKGEVRFENVSFRYPMRPERAALNDVSFEMRPGETVAIVGPSGAGKSTIFQLLLRFYDPQSGQIMLDGINIQHMKRTEYREFIAMVPQEPAIFADTARGNIRFGNPTASDAETTQAAKSAAIHEFLEGLPEGYDSWVGERGIMLSGGQKQRIAIARAVLRNAPLLLLDEATSSLDSESERAVQSAIETLSQHRTTLIVAHRLATVKKADRILVFDNGCIVAEGNHDTLLAAGGLYGRLAHLQLIDVNGR